MTKTTNSRLGACLLLGLAGCVGPVEIAPLPYSHPANPDAPAGKTSDAGSGLAPGADGGPTDAPAGDSMDGMKMPHDTGRMSMTAGGHAGMKGMKAETSEGKYQCPMHSQVRSDKPGKCPVCGMPLVNKGEAPKHEEDHER